ncbi:MAG TPA: glycosyltransferase family 1 protein [Terriglobales bacterium]|nr:glycosyltransferase family 1 protein [Terriglobales bacterium]
MIRIFLNGLAASSGSGLTYLHNVVPHLSALPNVRTILAVQPALKDNFENFPGVTLICPPETLTTLRRFWFEQRRLPDLIRKSQADVLISAGNFALKNSPVPQILLSGNSLYTSADFRRDLRSRGEYGMLADNFYKGMLAKKSVRWADLTITPSEAFASELRRWTSKSVLALHHGFDGATFFADSRPLSREMEKEFEESGACLRLLFVSHYNYYRNFETLIRALPLICEKLKSKKVKLLLTCKLKRGANPGAYDATDARRLVQKLGVSEHVVELGAVPYACIHQLYRRCHIYVTPAYAETFAHPLVEAMACGLPVVASDIPVHREVCGEAARYFQCFSVAALADTVANIAQSADLNSQLVAAGRERSAQFSWAGHVQHLLSQISVVSMHSQPATLQTHLHLGRTSFP